MKPTMPVKPNMPHKGMNIMPVNVINTKVLLVHPNLTCKIRNTTNPSAAPKGLMRLSKIRLAIFIPNSTFANSIDTLAIVPYPSEYRKYASRNFLVSGMCFNVLG